MGIAAGAGQYRLVIAGSLLGITLTTVVRFATRWLDLDRGETKEDG